MQDSIPHTTSQTSPTPQQTETADVDSYQSLEQHIVSGMQKAAAEREAQQQAAHNSARHAAHTPHPIHRTDTDSLPLDSASMAKADSLAIKKGPVEGEVKSGVILIPDGNYSFVDRVTVGGLSWIYGILLIVFCLVAFRFKNNKKYLNALFKNLTEVRERHNMFDDTVRETSFLTMLNLLWCVGAGVILYSALVYLSGQGFDPMHIGHLSLAHPILIGICMGICVLYSIVMWIIYWIVGNVFADRVKAGMWAKGFAASQAIVGIVFFPLALLCLSYPSSLEVWLITALTIFISGKFVFLWKGFRIFFTQFSSWVLFLYYLCSLEVIPLILTYCGAAVLCRIFH